MKLHSYFLSLVWLFGSLAVAQTALERTLASRVSQSLLQQTVRNLVYYEPRFGGTKRGDQSAKYVLRKFREYGLRAEIVEDPELLAFTNERWLLRVDQPKLLRGLIKHEWLAGFSPSVKSQKARSVYVGPDDTIKEGKYDSLVVVTDRPIDQKLYNEFVKSGAVCILTYGHTSETKYTNWAFITSLKSSEHNPIPVFNISFNNGSHLKSELEEGTQIILSFMTRTNITIGKPKTVIATIPGESDEYYLVCAHGDSDSGGPGADDNASGMAGVLEVARVLNTFIQSKQLPKPHKSMKFIVWGTEHFSSQSYIKQHAEELEKILGVLNYDEIGTGASRNCLYFESNDITHNESLMRTLNSIGEEYVEKKGFWTEATTNPSQGGTDSYSFLPESLERLNVPHVKIPSVTIYTAAWDEPARLPQTKGWTSKAWKGHPDSVIVDYSKYYHSSLDIPSLTTEKEPFNMVWAVKAVAIALLRLAW